MYSSKDGIRYALQYLEEVQRSNIKIDRAILFGSYEKDKAGRYSDVDLALISDQFTDNPIKNRRMLPVSFTFSKIEPHLFPTKDVGRDPFLSEEILKTGIELPLP